MLTFNAGHALLDPVTGAPLQFVDEADPERRFLLTRDLPWHTAAHLWGSGHLVAAGRTVRWSTPAEQHLASNLQSLEFDLGPELRLVVERSGGAVLTERYSWRNSSARDVTITGLGVQTPFADLYPSAAEALPRCVHAHVFTGGSWAWVLAQPMSGRGRCLGLIVRRGGLWGYSIESRNTSTFSNARGHIVLQVTDRARNADAFGGQPELLLPAGGSYELEWTLGWYDDVTSFLADTEAPASLSSTSAPVGGEITVTTDRPVSCPSPHVRVTATGAGAAITSERPGSYPLHFGDARTEVHFHVPVRDAVRRRARYIVDHQRPIDRAGSLAHAFVPVDTRTLLTIDDGGWADWTDGSERVGMAVPLQRARNLGWLVAPFDAVLQGWATFAAEHLIDHSGATRRGSADPSFGTRLYDAPWFAEFFLERFAATRAPTDLALARKILLRVVELGAGTFLAIGYAETASALAHALRLAGDQPASDALRASIITSAEYFLDRGEALPEHEVAYEQSIVAPLLNLLIEAHRLTGDERFLHGLEQRLPWLLAFGGPQPHARLFGIAIRHWDGYWFGLERLWGDTFPHHWSALTATVLARLPDRLRTADTDALAGAIMRANLANYGADGGATCAFVMPSSVDGRAAHLADPLANDQDWHLALWLRLNQQEGFPLD